MKLFSKFYLVASLFKWSQEVSNYKAIYSCGCKNTCKWQIVQTSCWRTHIDLGLQIADKSYPVRNLRDNK